MPAAGWSVGASTTSDSDSLLLAAWLLTVRCSLRCDAEAVRGLHLEFTPITSHMALFPGLGDSRLSSCAPTEFNEG